MERDDERGYAHMLEHLAFGGSEHFPHEDDQVDGKQGHTAMA